MMVVPWPVSVLRLMPLTGLNSVPVKYSVTRLRTMQRMMPMKQVQAGRMSSIEDPTV